MGRYDGYIRVSRVSGREGESFISPDEQRKRIEAWATMTGNSVVEWHKSELDVPGTTMERPVLREAMARYLRARALSSSNKLWTVRHPW